MQKNTTSGWVDIALDAGVRFLIKILFCVFLFASTTYAGSGSKPRDCIYIETGLKVKEERRGDGQIDDCLIQNKEIYAKAVCSLSS